MEGILKQARKGFFKTLAGSFIFHAVMLAAALVFYQSEPKRVFFTPVYTVSIMEAKPSPKPSARAVEKKAPPAPEAPAAKKEALPEPEVEAPKESVQIKEKEIEPKAEKETPKAKPEEKVSIDESLKKLQENIKKREDKDLVASRIEALKKNKETESKKYSEGVEEIKRRLLEPKPAPKESGPSSSAKAAPLTGGVTRENLETKNNPYSTAITQKIYDNWYVIEEFKSDNINLIVVMKIDRKGNLIDYYIKKSSGNAIYDGSLLNAIKKSAPFPAVPKDFEEDFFEAEFRFCPLCRGKE